MNHSEPNVTEAMPKQERAIHIANVEWPPDKQGMTPNVPSIVSMILLTVQWQVQQDGVLPTLAQLHTGQKLQLSFSFITVGDDKEDKGNSKQKGWDKDVKAKSNNNKDNGNSKQDGGDRNVTADSEKNSLSCRAPVHDR